jgi:hypothetical protein
MPELDEERLLTTAFEGFRTSAFPYLHGGPGSAKVRSTVRRRRTAQRLSGVFAATLALAAAGGFALSRGHTPEPPAFPTSPSATTAPTQDPNPTKPPPAPAISDSGASDTATRQPADLMVSTSYLELNGGAGTMIVRIDNIGQATVNQYRLTVRTPPGLHVTAALGDCMTEPNRMPYRSTCGPLQPGETAHVNLTVIQDEGTAARNVPANQRTVTVQTIGVNDSSKDNDTTTYLIKTVP